MRSTPSGMIGALACLMSATLLSLPAIAYEEIDVEDGAVLEGRVTYDGRIPTRRIVPTADRDVCGDPRQWEQAEIGPENGLVNAVVYLERVERGKPWPEDLETPVIDNIDCMFKPHVQVMRPGEIIIQNSDPLMHNTKGYYGRRAAFNVSLPDATMTVTRELPRPGVVRFECDAHGWMEGWAFVLTHPYYAITDENGAFRIEDIPAGEYTLVTRQEYIGTSEQTVEVAAGETLELSIELE